METAQASRSSVYTCIGQRIKERRKLLKMNQAQLAELMGVSYQQVQKYENGTSQLSVSKLLRVANILKVSPAFFYDGIRVEDEDGDVIESDVIKRTRTEPLHILLVEDNPGDVILFRKAVKTCCEDAEIHNIYDAEAVMDFLNHSTTKYGKRAPDLVVLDLALPKITGMQLLKQIKKNPQTTDIPVIILTNSISVKEMQEAYRLGASGFIQKSLELAEYNKTIDIATRYWSQVVALPRM